MGCRCLSLFTLALLLAGAAPEPEPTRPTGLEVRDAVQQSIAEYKDLHPPVTQAQAKLKVEREVQEVRARLGTAYNIRSPKKRAAAIKKANDELEALVAEASAIVKDYRPEDRNRLMPLQLQSLAIGMVGRLTEKNQTAEGLGYEHRFVRCLKAVDKTAMLVQLEFHEAPTQDSESEPQLVKSPTFLLKGVQATAATENQLLNGVYDVVVTGQYSYDDDQGESRTVYVLEVFDPSKPFQ